MSFFFSSSDFHLSIEKVVPNILVHFDERDCGIMALRNVFYIA